MTEHMPVFDNQWIALNILASESGMSVEDILGEAIYLYVEHVGKTDPAGKKAMDALEEEYTAYDYEDEYGHLGGY